MVYEKVVVFLLPSLGSDKPTLLPYSINHTSNSDTLWEEITQGHETRKQVSLGAFLVLGCNSDEMIVIMVDVLLHMPTNSLILLSSKGKAYFTFLPLLHVGYTYNSNK